MAAQPHRWITPEEYLEIERAAEFRHEYYAGQMFLMPGGTLRHAIIIANAAGELRSALKKRPCIVTNSDMRMRVAEDGLYTYPDVSVVWQEPKFADRRTDTLLNPALIVEVLSPSTESRDRGFKFAQYRKLESLTEYALISQDEARVEVFRRRENGEWALAEFVGMDAVARFESVEAAIPLAELYAKVRFEEEEAEPPTSGR